MKCIYLFFIKKGIIVTESSNYVQIDFTRQLSQAQSNSATSSSIGSSASALNPPNNNNTIKKIKIKKKKQQQQQHQTNVNVVTNSLLIKSPSTSYLSGNRGVEILLDRHRTATINSGGIEEISSTTSSTTSSSGCSSSSCKSVEVPQQQQQHRTRLYRRHYEEAAAEQQQQPDDEEEYDNDDDDDDDDEESRNEALCDMIAKIQGDRLDNQRCELTTQDYSVCSALFLNSFTLDNRQYHC